MSENVAPPALEEAVPSGDHFPTLPPTPKAPQQLTAETSAHDLEHGRRGTGGGFHEFDESVEYSIDDDEVAFGATGTNDYFERFKKHNRQFSKGNMASMSSPAKSVSWAGAGAGAVHSSLGSPGISGLLEQHSGRISKPTDITPSQSNNPDSDLFEERKLGFGQRCLFHKTMEQYFNFDLNENRSVLVSFHVNRITEIDNLKERFRVNFWITFSWLPTFEEFQEYKLAQSADDLEDWTPRWVPIIEFPDAMRIWKVAFAERRPSKGRFTVIPLHGKADGLGYDPAQCKFIRCKLDCDIAFSSNFLLLNFPFDCQDLPISIHEASGGCSFVPETRKRAFASATTITSVMEEWEFHNMIVELGVLPTGTATDFLAQLKVRLKMRRRFEVYLWSVVFFMSCISGLTLVSFAVPEESLGERLAMIITLLLTSVAYQSSVFQSMPNVPYLTLLDRYIITSFLFMTCVTIESGFLSLNALNYDDHNLLMFGATSAVFIGYHIFFLIWAHRVQNWEKRKLFLPSKGIEELLNSASKTISVEWMDKTEITANLAMYSALSAAEHLPHMEDIQHMYSLKRSKSVF